LDAYVHLTSPIRRLVDLLNMIQLQRHLGLLDLSAKAFEFYDRWLNEIDYINTTMRLIRKVQNECSLLDLCAKTPELLDQTFEGYCLDKVERNDGLFHFVVYLPKLRVASRVTMRENVENYGRRLFHLLLFHDEDTFKRKIRLQLLPPALQQTMNL
jgi:exoribonuclease R